MKRAFALGMLVALAVAGLAGPALAKGGNERIRASVVITGPGFERPIERNGTIHGFLYSEQSTSSSIGTLFTESGLMGFTEQGSGYYTISPDASTLGPKYEIFYTLQLPGTTNPIVEDLYPYASGGPAVFAHAGQRIEGGKVPAAWYVASRRLLTTLIGLGFPKTAPSVPAPVVTIPTSHAPLAQAPAREPIAVASTSLWPWVIAAAGLAALLVVGAFAGRRARPRIA